MSEQAEEFPEEPPPSTLYTNAALTEAHRTEMVLNLQLVTHSHNDDEYILGLKSCIKTDKEDLKRIVHGVLLSEAIKGGMELDKLKTRIKEIKGYKDNNLVDKFVKENYGFSTFFELLRKARDIVIMNENGLFAPVLDKTNEDLFNDALASVKNRDDKDRRKDERLAKQLESPANIEEFHRGANRIIRTVFATIDKHKNRDNAIAEISAGTGAGETLMGINYNFVETEYELMYGVKLRDECKKICGRSTLAKGLHKGQGPTCLIDSFAMEQKNGDVKGMFIAVKRGAREFTEEEIRMAKEGCLQRNSQKQSAAKKWEDIDAKRERAQKEQDAYLARQGNREELVRKMDEQIRATDSPPPPAAPAPPQPAPAPAAAPPPPAGRAPSPLPPPPPSLPQALPEEQDVNRTGSSEELEAIARGAIPPKKEMNDSDEESGKSSHDEADGFSDEGEELMKIRLEETKKKELHKKQQKEKKLAREQQAPTAVPSYDPPPPVHSNPPPPPAQQQRTAANSPPRPEAKAKAAEEKEEEEVPYGQLPPAPYILCYDGEKETIDSQIEDIFAQAMATTSSTNVGGGQQRKNMWDEDRLSPPTVQQHQQQQQQHQPPPPPAAPAPVHVQPVVQQQQQQPEAPKPAQNSVFGPVAIPPEAYQQPMQQQQLQQQQQHQQQPVYGQEQHQQQQMQPNYQTQAAAPYAGQPQQQQQQPQFPPTSPPPPMGDVMHAPMQQQQPLYSPVLPAHPQQYQQQQRYPGQNGSPPFDQGMTVSNSHYSQGQMQPQGGAVYAGAPSPSPTHLPYSPMANPQQYPLQQHQYQQLQYPPQASPSPLQPSSGPNSQSPLHVSVNNGPPPPGPEYQHPQQPGYHNYPPNPVQQPLYQGHPQDSGYRASPSQAAGGYPHGPTPPPSHYYGGAPPVQGYAPAHDYDRRPPVAPSHQDAYYGYGNNRGAGGEMAAPLPRRVSPRDHPDQYRDDGHYDRQPRDPRDDRRGYEEDRRRGGPEYDPYRNPRDHRHPQDYHQQPERRGDYYQAPAPRYPPTAHERRPVDSYEEQQYGRSREAGYAPAPAPTRSRNSPPPLEDWPPQQQQQQRFRDPYYHQQAPPPPHHQMTSSSTTRRTREVEEPRGFGRQDDVAVGGGGGGGRDDRRGFGRADDERRGGGIEYYQQPPHDRGYASGGGGGGGFGRRDSPPEVVRRPGDGSMEHAGRQQHQQQPSSGGYGSQSGGYDGRGAGGRADYEPGPPQYDRPSLVMDRPVGASTPLNRSRDTGDQNLWSFFERMKTATHRVRWQVVSILKCVRDKNRRRLALGRINEFELIEMSKMEELIQKGCGNDMEAYYATVAKYPQATKPFFQFFRDMEKDGLLNIYTGTVRNGKTNIHDETIYVTDPFMTPPPQLMLRRLD